MNNSHDFMTAKVIFAIFDILIIFGLKKEIKSDKKKGKLSKAIYGANCLSTEIPRN